MLKLSGKRAVVLGAAGRHNMGQVIARRFVQEGAKVLVAGRSILRIAAMARLDAVEVQPGLTMEPPGGRGPAPRMKSNEVTGIVCSERGADDIPDGR